MSYFYVKDLYMKGVVKMYRLFFLFLGCLILAGCMVGQSKSKSIRKNETLPKEVELSDYFPQENSTYSFKGEGSEFSSYKEDFFEKNGDYLPSIVENSGTRIFKVYELTNDGIYLVYEQPEYYEEAPLEIAAVKSQFKQVPLLNKPLEVGTQFSDWTISETNAQLSLAIGEFSNVIVTEQRDEKKQTVLKYYWAPQHGIIKSEFLSTNNHKFIVTSELESIH